MEYDKDKVDETVLALLYPMASRIIKDSIEAELIKPYDPENKSRKHAKYIPFWA